MTVYPDRVPVSLGDDPCGGYPAACCPPPKAWFVALLAGVGIAGAAAAIAAKTSRR